MSEKPTIIDALAMWSTWHGDVSPLGATGDYALDMKLADAFRALLYRPSLNDRLDWIYRETQRPRRAGDARYIAEIVSWWLTIHEASKQPVIHSRIQNREAYLQCAT
jgi:hypothetical protein